MALLSILAVAAADDPLPRADAVVVGRVADSRMIVHRKARSALFYVRLKVEVESVESGHVALRGAKELDLRCWREGADGHHPIPADGTRFHVSLLRHGEGYWTPTGLDAIELLDGSTGRAFPEIPRREFGVGGIVGGAVGLLILVAATYLRYRGRRDRTWGEAPDEGPPPEAEDGEG